MEQDFNSELVFNNSQGGDCIMKVFPDEGSVDLVGFGFSEDDQDIPLTIDVERMESTYFHLDKFQVGCLIDYLKRMYDIME